MSASRNLGASAARGEYLAFLDSDDVWVSNKLAEQVEIMADLPEAGMVYGRSLIWHSWSAAPDEAGDYFCELGVEPNQMVRPPRLVFLLLENRFQTPTTCNALIRKTIYASVGGFQDEFRGMFEDQAFFTKLCLFHPVYVSDACWAWYRQHDASCCSVAEKSGQALERRRPLLEWIARYFKSQQVRDPALMRALRKELLPLRHPALVRTIEHWRKWLRRTRKRCRAAPSRS